MKKVFAIVLTLAMLLSLAACAGGNATGSGGSSGSSGSGSSGGSSGSASPSASASVNLKVAYADPETSVFGKGAAAFKEKLEELSGGSMTCTMYPNGTLGSIPEVAAMIQQGTCDVSPIVTSSLVDFCSELGVFDLPFLFADYDEAREIIGGEAGSYLAGKMAESNMHVGSWMTMGFRETTSKKPINSIADFNGLKIRTQSNEVHQAIFSALGAAPTIINFSELYTAMEQGTVDAQENPYVNIQSNAYFEVQDYLVETNHVFQFAALLVSSSTYDKLSDEQKGWVDEAAAYAADVEWAATIADNETAKQACIDAGMTFVELSHDELLAATESVYGTYDAQYGSLLEMMGK